MDGVVRSYREIRDDYLWDRDIMNPEPDRVRIGKYIIQERLSQVDRILILLYADCHSYRKLGARLGLSRTTVQKKINQIKAAILRLYEQLKDTM